MPNNEEREYTVDDILKEFEEASESVAEESVETELPEEEVSVYKSTEFFEENSSSEPEDISQIVEEVSETEEAVEEIVEDDTIDEIDISEEILEIWLDAKIEERKALKK